MFDWEHGIVLHPVQGIRALTPSEGDDSWDFSSCSRNLGYISSYSAEGRSKHPLVQRSQDSSLVRTDSSGSYTRFGRIIQTLLEVSWEIIHPFLVSRDFGIPMNFQEEPGLGPFRNTELRGPHEVSSDVTAPVQIRWDIVFSLGIAQNIQTSLCIVRRKTSLHSSHCKEIRRSFDSGNLGIHCT